MENMKIDTIDAYIQSYSVEVQELLSQLRGAIHEAAPEATEKISYGMPTFFLHKNLVHFAICKNHMGFYPSPSGIEAFSEELVKYEKTKGAIHFPLDEPMPIELIQKIVRYRVTENMAFAKPKKNKK